MSESNMRPTMVFDEELYLANNADVRQAVENGLFPSGLAHYRTWGHGENRPGAPSPQMESISPLIESTGRPVPPDILRRRVHGDADLHAFLHVGRALSGDITRFIPTEIAHNPNSRILDFGCGCGRVALFLHKSLAGALYGTDIDQEAIAWCTNHLSDLASFSSNLPLPPLKFDNSYFDLVYSISIFTHLPEDMQMSWLKELSRVTKIGGYALITVHGKYMFPAYRLSEHELSKFKESGFYYSEAGETEGLPSFYGSTIHSDKYIKSKWSKFFEIREIVRGGANGHQDVVICRRRR